jgi:hypothetical protein
VVSAVTAESKLEQPEIVNRLNEAKGFLCALDSYAYISLISCSDADRLVAPGM